MRLVNSNSASSVTAHLLKALGRPLLVRSCKILLITTLSIATDVSAQESPLITGNCSLTIALDTIARFGALNDPSSIGLTAGMIRLPSGQFLLTHQYSQSQVHVYDATGAHVRSFGRDGEGPGEYRSAGYLDAMPADSVSVFDLRLGRRVILSPDLAYARTEAMPIQNVAAVSVLPDNAYLVNGSLQTREAAGYRLHLIRNGEIVRSFGALNPSIRRDQPAFYDRVMTQVNGDAVWIAHRGRYVLELWSLDGERRLSIQRDVPWFPPSPVTSVISDSEPPRTRVRQIHAGSDGIVWVAISVADRRWKTAVEFRGRVQGILAVHQASDQNQYFDTVLEAIDVQNKRCVASVKFDERLHRFLDDGSFTTLTEIDGVPILNLLRPRIQNLRD